MAFLEKFQIIEREKGLDKYGGHCSPAYLVERKDLSRSARLILNFQRLNELLLNPTVTLADSHEIIHKLKFCV